MKATVALIAEYDPAFPPHAATERSIKHSSDRLGIDVHAEWLSTTALEPSIFARCDGIWVAPGSPYKDMDKALWAIRHAREQGIPCFGTCGGFQHMIIEYARNVLGYHGAHAEYDPDASDLFVSRLDCSLVGREMLLQFPEDSLTAAIYGRTTAVEQYYCGFGVNPNRVDALRKGPLKIAGSDREGEVRVVELPGHPFFVGTLFVPQMRSCDGQPHPLVSAFVRAVTARAGASRPEGSLSGVGTTNARSGI